MALITPVLTKSAIEITSKLAFNIWNQHYIPIIGQAQVKYMLEKFQSPQAISEQIHRGTEYFLIHHNHKPVGYMALVPEPSEKKLMLSKIYVDTDFRGLHLGVKLLNFAKTIAQNKKYNTLWLTVNKNNQNAISWYQKNGFSIKDSLVIDIGNGFVMDDYLMEAAIN